MEATSNLDRALKLAKGKAQRAVVQGKRCVYGNDLPRAYGYKLSYQRSVKNLLARLRDAGIEYEIDQAAGPRGGTSNQPAYLIIKGE